MLASRRTEAVSGLAAAEAVVAPPARGFAKLRLVEKMTHRKHNVTFVIAAGGTGGHVLPGLEVAKELRSRGHDCSFVGTPRGLEGRLIPAAGFPIEFVAAGALKQVSMARRFRTFLDMPEALLAAREILERGGRRIFRRSAPRVQRHSHSQGIFQPSRQNASGAVYSSRNGRQPGFAAH